MSHHWRLLLGCIVLMLSASPVLAYGILASESGASIQSSRILVSRIGADEIQLVAQIKMSNPSSPAVWLIPIERKTSTEVDDNREVTVEGFQAELLEQLHTLTQPQLKPMCDGMQDGTPVAVNPRSGDFAPAAAELSTFKVYPSDRADSLPNFFMAYPGISLTDTQTETLEAVKNNAYIFVAVYIDPSMVTGGGTSPIVSIRYKTQNGAKLSLQSMVGSLNNQAPDLIIWTLDSGRQQLPTPVDVDYGSVQIEAGGDSNYDQIFDEAIDRVQTGGFVTDMAQMVTPDEMSTAFLAELVKPGISDYLTRFHARPVPAVLKTRIASVEVLSGGGGDVSRVHEVKSAQCTEDMAMDPSTTQGGETGSGGQMDVGGAVDESGGRAAPSAGADSAESGGTSVPMGGAQATAKKSGGSGSCSIGTPSPFPPSLFFICMLILLPIVLRRRNL